MENNIKTIADQILLFAAHTITGERTPDHVKNPFVIRYALDYILKVIKQDNIDSDVAELLKNVFWYIVNNYKTA